MHPLGMAGLFKIFLAELFLGQHRTIPALRLKHRSGSCGTASALPKCSIMSGCGTRIVLRGQRPLALCDRCPCFGSLFPPLVALTFAASSIICAFGLASAVPRSPYRHLELCGIALNHHIAHQHRAGRFDGVNGVFARFCAGTRRRGNGQPDAALFRGDIVELAVRSGGMGVLIQCGPRQNAAMYRCCLGGSLLRNGNFGRGIWSIRCIGGAASSAGASSGAAGAAGAGSAAQKSSGRTCWVLPMYMANRSGATLGTRRSQAEVRAGQPGRAPSGSRLRMHRAVLFQATKKSSSKSSVSVSKSSAAA